MRIDLAYAEFNCRVLGNGNRVLIAFHGFGQDGSIYEAIQKSHRDLTIYSFDLPFHGSTTVHHNEPYPIASVQVQELVEQILQLTGAATFSLIGFSIGARFVFPIIEKFSARIDQVVLLAPDGIKEHLWYRLATSTAASRIIFRKILKHPRVLQRAGMLLSAIRWVDKRNLRFALRSLDTFEKREQVYHTWVALRLLRLDMSRISQKLNENKIKLRIFVGERDTVINKSSVKPLLRLVTNARLIVLPCGHNSMIACLSNRGIDII